MGNKYNIPGFAGKLVLIFVLLSLQSAFSQEMDTSYSAIAPQNIINMLNRGKAPSATIQISFNYNTGLMDLAANDNTFFRKSDFIGGRNFGTRYGYGFNLTGKLPLHKEGNVRLNVSAGYNLFLSNFIVSSSPEGIVHYNVVSGALGIENNFTPDRKFKPYVGLDVIMSFISGSATLKTDSSDFNLAIKSSMRIGLAFNLGFEYAINNSVGLNLGMKLTHANLINRESKTSANPNETYLNDAKVTGTPIPFAGWKQFVYYTFYTGINVYFGSKFKK